MSRNYSDKDEFPLGKPKRSASSADDDERTPFIRSKSPARGSGATWGTTAQISTGVTSLTHSVKRMCSATLSLSLLEIPSDDRRNSAWLAGWNVSNLIQGTGMLGIPYAVQQCGWGSIPLIILVAILCSYSGVLIGECLYQTSPNTGRRKRIRASYPAIGEAAWPGFGFLFVAIVQVMEMFGATTLYVVLLGNVFYDNLEGLTPLGQNEWAAICACIALPLVFIERVSVLAWLSMLSVICLFACNFTIVIFGITQYENWSLSNIPTFNPETFPVGFGIITFSFTAHAIFPAVEASLKNPSSYTPMMHVSFSVAALVKLVMGLTAVLTFGPKTQEVITVNMKGYHGFGLAATIFVSISVFLAFPLVIFIVKETWDTTFIRFFPHMKKGAPNHWVWLIITRPLIVGLSLFTATVVPHFGLLMAVIGSASATCLCFIFSPLFHMKLKWNKLKWYHIVVDICTFIFGLIVGSLGLFFSGKALAKKINGV